MRTRVAGIVLFAWLLGTMVDLRAATISAKSCNASDVQAALNLASAGDTVTIPAGTCSWTSAVTWVAPPNVTVRGAGSLTTLGGGDATVIVDDSVTNSPLLKITAAATGTFRLAGLTIRGGNGVLKDGGVVMVWGPATVRLDHLHFDVANYNAGKILVIGDRVHGVLDHSIIDAAWNAAIYFHNGWGTDGAGNSTWAAPTEFGSANFFFLEDNVFRATTASPTRMGDAFTASRVVWRFNTIQGGSGLEMHATGHAGDDRGPRATEGYGNRFTVLPNQANPPYMMADLSSGTAVVWGNVAESDALKNLFIFNVTRKNRDTYPQWAAPDGWGYCGTQYSGAGSGWDGNTDAATGYPCLDQPGRGQGDLLTGMFANKNNTRTGNRAWANQALEPIYIWGNVGTQSGGWGGAYYADRSGGRVVANRDYYPQAGGMQTSSASPFDGRTGTGWGTLANRPATCTPGVGYFATDQGNWNTSTSNPEGAQQNGADGVLYKCTATNTWTLYYTPYTYPHPLQGGASSPPPSTVPLSAPSNLRINPGSF